MTNAMENGYYISTAIMKARITVKRTLQNKMGGNKYVYAESVMSETADQICVIYRDDDIPSVSTDWALCWKRLVMKQQIIEDAKIHSTPSVVKICKFGSCFLFFVLLLVALLQQVCVTAVQSMPNQERVMVDRRESLEEHHHTEEEMMKEWKWFGEI